MSVAASAPKVLGAANAEDGRSTGMATRKRGWLPEGRRRARRGLPRSDLHLSRPARNPPNRRAEGMMATGWSGPSRATAIKSKPTDEGNVCVHLVLSAKVVLFAPASAGQQRPTLSSSGRRVGVASCPRSGQRRVRADGPDLEAQRRASKQQPDDRDRHERDQDPDWPCSRRRIGSAALPTSSVIGVRESRGGLGQGRAAGQRRPRGR